MFMANLSSTDPVYDEAGPSYDSDILSEVHDHDNYQDAICKHHEVHEMHDDVQPNCLVDLDAKYTGDGNMIPNDQYVKDNAEPVVQNNVPSVPNNAYLMILNEMHEQTAQCVSMKVHTKVVDTSLTAELTTYKEQVELYERRAKFEFTKRVQKIEERLRIVITDRNIKEDNLKKELHSVKMQLNSTINYNKSMVEEVTSLKKNFKEKENKYLEEFLDIKALKEKVEDKLLKQDQSLQTIYMLRKPKPYYDEQRKTTALLTENKNLKVQINEKMKCATMDSVKPKVLAPGMYFIDVEPILPRCRNNRELHLDYLKHLKESIETLREIVEEARVERPLDKSLASSCLYTKQSQELLEYVIGTCPKDFNKRDKKQATTPFNRKKQVTFEDQCETSNNNTQKHVEQLNIQKTNVLVIPYTRVNSCTDASGSKPMRNTKRNRISSVKSVNKKKVEEYPRTNKSSLKKENRVDSSISSVCIVINSNSYFICKTCNKCFISANHDMCVVNYLNSVNASSSVKNVVSKVKKVWKPKQVKQFWKATGKLLTNLVINGSPQEGNLL
nr:hypothetical protein [Tanacetum cinerariifolium]